MENLHPKLLTSRPLTGTGTELIIDRLYRLHTPTVSSPALPELPKVGCPCRERPISEKPHHRTPPFVVQDGKGGAGRIPKSPLEPPRACPRRGNSEPKKVNGKTADESLRLSRNSCLLPHGDSITTSGTTDDNSAHKMVLKQGHHQHLSLTSHGQGYSTHIFTSSSAPTIDLPDAKLKLRQLMLCFRQRPHLHGSPRLSLLRIAV